MCKVAFFDTKPYDKASFDSAMEHYEHIELHYFEEKLNERTAKLAEGYDVVCAFVNDDINASCIDTLANNGVKLIALRCAGYSNVDMKAANGKIPVVRVPAYSPHAVAEHAIAMLMTLNRKLHRAYNRTREFNFNIVGLMGTDLYGKTMGVIGTGKIGRIFINICKGFGMNVIAYDPFPAKDTDINYVSLDQLLRDSDFLSLHCPLTKESFHILNEKTFSIMKDGVFIVNTSRGALIDSRALLDALKDGKVKGAALDVYEEEALFFFEDKSDSIIKDDILALLVAKPNVLITSHQGFFTEEAIRNIADITLENIDSFVNQGTALNQVTVVK